MLALIHGTLNQVLPIYRWRGHRTTRPFMSVLFPEVTRTITIGRPRVNRVTESGRLIESVRLGVEDIFQA